MELTDKIKELQDQITTMIFIVESLQNSLSNALPYISHGDPVKNNIFKYLLDLNSAIKSLEIEKMSFKELPEVIQSFSTLETSKSNNPDDYLVVEDKESPSTWHLQVKADGEYNHRLCGAAWAALHKGFRGNKYQGPKKREAIKKLKSIYKKMGWDLPQE